MDNSQIQQLLAKYFEGNTTLEEEKMLRQYLSTAEDTDEERRLLKRQFEIFHSVSGLTFDTVALDDRILKKITSWEQQVDPPVRKFRRMHLLVAASVALAIAVSGVVFFKAQSSRAKDTFDDPRLAYAETQRALLFVSQKMNQGMEPLSNISRINTGTEQLKNLEKMDESLGMLNLVSFINQSSNLKK
jgi:hypothetical protein